MSTYTQILYQIVFSTKFRRPVLSKDKRPDLYAYMAGILAKKKCKLYRIGGVEDHVHIVTHLHPSVALADLVKDIKLASSQYILSEKLFNTFQGWQEGYGAFTYSIDAKDRLVKYVMGQEAHHSNKSFADECQALFERHRIERNKFNPSGWGHF